MAGQEDGPAIRADFLRPRRLDKRLRHDWFPGEAVECIEESVAVGKHHDLPRLAVHRQVSEHRHLSRIPVVYVVWRELIVPAKLTGIRIEGHQRGGIQIVALAGVAVVVGPGITGAEEHQVLLRIVRAGHPDRSAATQVRIPSRPCVATRIVRAGDGVEPPRALAGLRIVRVDEPANAVLGTCNPDDDLVLHHQRSNRGRVPHLVVLELDVIHNAAGLHVEREEVRIDRRNEDLIPERCDAAVDIAAAGAQIVRETPPIGPQRSSGFDVQRDHVAGRIGEVHHTVKDKRCALEVMASLNLVHPYRAQLLDILTIDLVEPGESLCVVGTVVGQPAAWLAHRVAHTVVRQLCRQLDGDQDREEDRRRRFHCVPPSETRNATRSSRAAGSRRSRKPGIVVRRSAASSANSSLK